MNPVKLSELLKLPAAERVVLAMVLLWESLSNAEREAEAVSTEEQAAEVDRRLAEHLANPESALLWEELRLKLPGR